MGSLNWHEWLAQRWQQFDHSYINASTQETWECRSLKQASELYTWRGNTRAETNLQLDHFATLFRSALSSNDNDQTATNCREVLRWGGVGQNANHATSIWIERNQRGRTLVKAIQDSLKALHEENSEYFCADRPMDSSATKIMTIADSSDKGMIIYDSRVAAALGYLAKKYLLENNEESVPPSHSFTIPPCRGLHLNRDPSSGTLIFPKTGSTPRRFERHARGKILANRLIAGVAKTTKASARDWEQALFMVGYTLPED
jgi:hypothetical protein